MRDLLQSLTAVDLELALRRAGPHYRAEARCTLPGTDWPTETSAPLQIDEARLLALTLDPAAYGLALGRMLLAGPIGDIFREACAISQRDGLPLRVRLALAADAAELHALRWETLRDPARPGAPLLGVGAQVLFSRYLGSRDWPPLAPRPAGELRALVVLAGPPDLPDYGLHAPDLEAERALITASFRPIPTAVLGQGQATLEALTRRLHDGYDILYLLAHGRADTEGDTLLYLEGADGLAEAVSGGALAARIAELRAPPRLIALGSCESAGDLRALGSRLAQAGVPAVLAAQGRVSLDTLRRFLPVCMQTLLQSGRIDEAVARARGAVRDRPDFWAPVLFLRCQSGLLWAPPQGVSKPPQTPEALLAALPLDDIPAPQTLPTPHRMPIRPNPLFVGRDDELRTLARLLREGGVVIASGIGGMGKTQLAVELAHRYGRHFAGGVFWVSCADPPGIPGEVAACGLLMGLPLDGRDLDAQVQLTRAAWETDLPRLLIFDNCEEEQTLRRWLPATGGARVFVTSRRASWSPTFRARLVPLAVLPRASSAALLLQLAPHLTTGEAEQIAVALGDLPLALHLSGCYLSRYRLAVPDYLAKLGRVQLQHPSLTGRGVEDMPTQRAPHVERAFALSLARLEANDPTDDLARQLLARAACFAPGEPFLRDWLEQTVAPEGDAEELLLARRDAVERLLKLGLLERTADQSVRLHRLLAAFVAQALRDDAASPAVEQCVGELAARANSAGLPAAMQPLLPHLRHAVQRAAGRQEEQVARLLNALGYYLDMVGAYAEAQPLLERAVAIREQVLGDDHPETAFSLNGLAELYQAEGMYERAQPLYERALEIRERVLDSQHQETAMSLLNLALVYELQGMYEWALPLYERALVLYEQVLESNEPFAALNLNNLAVLFEVESTYERVLPLYRRRRERRGRVRQHEPPRITLRLTNLASLLKEQAVYRRAVLLYERGLAMCEQMLGEDHPHTAMSLHNLAHLLQAEGAYERAAALYERALAIHEQILGDSHPSTATSLNNLAMLYGIQGLYGRAVPLMERAVEIRRRVLGADHPATATSLNNLAVLYEAQGLCGRALLLYEQALKIRERTLGERHPHTAVSLSNLAYLLQVQGASKRALPLYERALAIVEQVVGLDHPSLAPIINNLGALREARGDYKRALSLYRRALSICRRSPGAGLPNTRAVRANLVVCRAAALRAARRRRRVGRAAAGPRRSRAARLRR